MKVLQIYKDYYPPVRGGIEGHINLLSNYLKRMGVEVEVLVSNTKASIERERINGVSVTRVPQFGRIASAPLNMTFLYWLKRLGRDADILHFHFPNPTAEISYLFSGMQKNVVLSYHSDIVRQKILGKLYTPFLFRFFKKVRVIIVGSPNYLNSSKVLDKFRYKCRVVPYGINISAFTYCSNMTKDIASLRKTYGPNILLFVGRFRYYKGLHILIKAMNNIEGKLLLIGAGPLENDLRRQVAKMNLNNKVVFLGELSDQEMHKFLRACDIFVFPSIYRSEAFGIAQLEAMACGKPTICTEIGTGTSFANIHNRTGLVIPPNDVLSLIRGVNYLLDHPELREKYGKTGLERVEKLFSSEKMIDSIIKIYQRILVTKEFAKIDRHLEGKKLQNIPLQKDKIKAVRLITCTNTGRHYSDSLTKRSDTERMKARLPLEILLINQYYPPDTSATANVAHRISEELSEKHSVTVLAGRPSYNPKEIHSWYLFRTIIQGKVKIQRVGSSTYSRHHIVGRIINYLTFILLAIPRSLPDKADVFLCMTDPPITAIIGAILSFFRKRPFCYYIQDLHPDMALVSGLVRYGSLVYIWDNIHRWALRKSSLIIALGEDMRKLIVEKGIEPDKIEVVRHGARIYENLPSPDHPIVQEIRCGFSFAILHAGNLGFYGAWNTLIEAAKLLKQENVGFVFVGDGAAKQMIKRLASSCDNVRFLPFRPSEEVPYVLAAGDIHIVTVRRGLEGMVVPSKLYTIIGAGRPVLAVVPKNIDVSKIVTKNGCGIVADPDDPWSVVTAIRSLLIDRAKLKEMSRQALTTAHEYEREKHLKRLVKLIEDVSVIENVMA